VPTRPYKTWVSQGATRGEKEPSTLIIDLTISNKALGPLDSWEIGQPGLTTSDHLVIWASWEPLDEESDPREAIVTRWDISILIGDTERIEVAEHT
jgi:hypothetical protein